MDKQKHERKYCNSTFEINCRFPENKVYKTELKSLVSYPFPPFPISSTTTAELQQA